jgi:hypothetical protein
MYDNRMDNNVKNDVMHREICRHDCHGDGSARGSVDVAAMRGAHASELGSEQYSYKKAALTSFTWGRFSLFAKR